MYKRQALYGSQAANGVILITTKKGNTVGRRDIHFSTGLTFEKAFSLPEMQNSYGVSDVTDSWGEKENLTVYDNLGDFFRTGLTSITSVSVNSGNDKLQTYFSVSYTHLEVYKRQSFWGKENSPLISVLVP